jgi:hypothetical protein
MSDDQVFAVVCEVRSLERLQVVIRLMGDPADEWRYALVAIAQRLEFSRYALSHADPALVRRAEDRLAAEVVLALQHPHPVTHPITARIH